MRYSTFDPPRPPDARSGVSEFERGVLASAGECQRHIDVLRADGQPDDAIAALANLHHHLLELVEGVDDE